MTWISGQMELSHRHALLPAHHRHTPGAIHRPHGHNDRHRRFRFMRNMLRTCTAHLLHHLWGLLDRRRRELFVARCLQCQILCLKFDGQEANNKLCRMFMGVDLGVMINVFVVFYLWFCCGIV